jgi:UDP-N-acetylmuramate dehydrogenase
MAGLQEFAEIVKRNEPLAPYTYLKVGGAAEVFVQPRSRTELAGVLQQCRQEQIPVHVLGGGGNVLVRDEGVKGAVLRLSERPFTAIAVEGKVIRAGAGAGLSSLISQTASAGLGGLEMLVGIPGTVGGAVRCNAGDRSGEIGQFVRRAEVMDDRGTEEVRERQDLSFSPGSSNLDDVVLLAVDFELEPDSPDALVKRLRKAWIQRKASQPLSFQPAGRIFKNPRGKSAAALIDQAGLAKTRVGAAEVSDRNSNYIIAYPGATARDVLRLIDLVKSRVKEQFAVELELEIAVW